MKLVYLDNNATTAVAPEVLEVMLPFFKDLWGNPSSMHAFGGQVRQYVDNARRQVADFLGADKSEIIFTSCGTESNNMAIRGTMEAAPGRLNFITTRVEHPAVLEPARMLKDRGCNVIELDVDSSGQIDLEQLKRALGYGPALVSIMWANNETGVIFPIREITEMVKAAGGIMHTDAVQAVGKIPVDLRNINVDLLSLSGHKLHAPKGVGALYVRRGTRIAPLLLGGHQEGGKRGGTENVPYIVGLGKACELAQASLASPTQRAAPNFSDEITRVSALRDRLQKGILEKCSDVKVNGDQIHRLPNTLNISFLYIEGESILYHLSDLGIAASSGSACTSGSLEPSHVIRAMGVPFIAAHGSIRFSLSRYNTDQDIDYVLEHLPPIIRKLRDISPFGRT
ncbi:MAG: cysteine desulfurase NifS [Kiritimatiellia bacterium]|nr:cysteine desulfurase NifS [Kiritimatiellia bacterium]